MNDHEHLHALGCPSSECTIAPPGPCPDGTPRNNGPCFCLCGLDTIARLRVRQALAILHRRASVAVQETATTKPPAAFMEALSRVSTVLGPSDDGAEEQTDFITGESDGRWIASWSFGQSIHDDGEAWLEFHFDHCVRLHVIIGPNITGGAIAAFVDLVHGTVGTTDESLRTPEEAAHRVLSARKGKVP